MIVAVVVVAATLFPRAGTIKAIRCVHCRPYMDEDEDKNDDGSVKGNDE